MNQGTSTAYAYLKLGTERIQVARADGAHAYNMGTTCTVRHMEVGDKIFADYGGGVVYGDPNLYTHMVGFLIPAN